MTESKYSIQPLEFDDISTYAIADRASKVHVGLFGRTAAPDDTVGDFIDKLPRILAGNQLRDLIAAIRRAKDDGKPILWGMGGHVIKCGLGPILIDMMRGGFVTGIAMNGSAAIHDFEIALHGSTSEEVENELKTGRFGMARETGEYLNRAIGQAATDGIGMGEGVGRFLHEDPQVPNYGPPGRGAQLREGMTVAIEPMVNVGGWRTRLLPDQWTVVTADGSLSAHFEHTIAITKGKAEILTKI